MQIASVGRCAFYILHSQFICQQLGRFLPLKDSPLVSSSPPLRIKARCAELLESPPIKISRMMLYLAVHMQRKALKTELC